MPFAQTNHINKKIYLLEQDGWHPILIPAVTRDELLPLFLSLSVWLITEWERLSLKLSTWIWWCQTFDKYHCCWDPTEMCLYCIISSIWGRFLPDEDRWIDRWVYGWWGVGASLRELNSMSPSWEDWDYKRQIRLLLSHCIELSVYVHLKWDYHHDLTLRTIFPVSASFSLQLENFIQENVRSGMEEMKRTAVHTQTAAMLEMGTNLLSQSAEQTRKLTDVETQVRPSGRTKVKSGITWCVAANPNEQLWRSHPCKNKLN